MNELEKIYNKRHNVVLAITLIFTIVLCACCFFINRTIFKKLNKEIDKNIENNIQAFRLPDDYNLLTYSLGKEYNEEDYLLAIERFDNIIENPKDEMEEAISYNLNYLKDVSNKKNEMKENVKKKVKINSFSDEKNKYGLITKKEDLQILNNNSDYIRLNIDKIEDEEDRRIILNNLDILDAILNLNIKDEALTMKYFKYNPTIISLIYFPLASLIFVLALLTYEEFFLSFLRFKDKILN